MSLTLNQIRVEAYAPEFAKIVRDIGQEFGGPIAWAGDPDYKLEDGFVLRADKDTLVPYSACEYGRDCEANCCSMLGAKSPAWVDASEEERLRIEFDNIRDGLHPQLASDPFETFVVKMDKPVRDLREVTHRTGVSTVGEREGCRFLSPDAEGHWGCSIHRYALQSSLPVPSIKPQMCVLYPVWLDIKRRPKVVTVRRCGDWPGWKTRPKCGDGCLKPDGNNPPLILHKVKELVYYFGELQVLAMLIGMVDDLVEAPRGESLLEDLRTLASV